MFLTYFEAQSIIDAKPASKDLATWLSDQVYHIFRIKEDLDELNQREKSLKSQYKIRMKKIEIRRREIRERCRHACVFPYSDNPPEAPKKYGRCTICGDTLVEIETPK